MQTMTIRPGLLVSLKTTIRGNVSYQTKDLEQDHLTAEGQRKAKWETERTIVDPAEFEEATKVRGKARSLITGACIKSAFGLLCPENNEANLTIAMREAQQHVFEFNRKASLSNIEVYVVCGRIAQDDVQAARAIASEVRDLMVDMQEGLKQLDVKKVREAAQQAKNIGRMLSPEAAEKIAVAVDVARKSAREIVKAGEQAAVEIDHAAIKKLVEQRTAFLDLDEQADILSPTTDSRAVDFETMPMATDSPQDTSACRPQIEL